MNKTLLVCALGVAFAGATAARADNTFSLTFNGTSLAGENFQNGTAANNYAAITFTAATSGTTHGYGNNQYTSYEIDSISGTMTIGGDTYSITGLDSPPNSTVDEYTNNPGTYTFDPGDIDFDITKIGGNDSDTFNQIVLDYNSATGAYTYEAWYCFSGPCSSSDTGTIRSGHEDITLDTTPAATPEPGSLALLGTSILGGAGILRRRFRA